MVWMTYSWLIQNSSKKSSLFKISWLRSQSSLWDKVITSCVLPLPHPLPKNQLKSSVKILGRSMIFGQSYYWGDRNWKVLGKEDVHPGPLILNPTKKDNERTFWSPGWLKWVFKLIQNIIIRFLQSKSTQHIVSFVSGPKYFFSSTTPSQSGLSRLVRKLKQVQNFDSRYLDWFMLLD